MKCYYHKADLDGKCSAAIVKRKYPECELIGVDYPDRPDFEKIKPEDTVFVVDFSFEPDDMISIINLTEDNLVWIDHHKTAIEKIKNSIPDEYTQWGKQEIGKGACELTWEYLFPDERMPEAVRLLGRYDIWDKSDLFYWQAQILPFQYSMRTAEWMPDADDWQLLFDSNKCISEVIRSGFPILFYDEHQNNIYAKAMAFPVMFDEHKAWAINKALSNSKIFETIKDNHERPLWILFNYRDGIWKYSLYSAPDSGIDVSEIAVKYGGGHAGAAGFQSDKYLLKESI